MRPRRIRRGERSFMLHHGTMHHSCFNAATANSPWRTQELVGDMRPTLVLQCGHGEFAVENASRYPEDNTIQEASMRPRRIRRGEPAQEINHCGPDARASMRPRRIRRGELSESHC